MVKKKTPHNRLDALFSEIEQPTPEADKNVSVSKEQKQEGEQSQPRSERAEKNALRSSFTDSPHKQRLGWDDFLNAIDRSEKIGFSFEKEDVSPLQEADIGESGKTFKAPLQIGDEILGALEIESESELSENEADLLTTVAQQVAQHVENLRLLEQAEQYRTEAEQATRRLTLEGWENYLQTPGAPARGYVYDQKNVTQFDPSTYEDSWSSTEAFTQDLLVREEAIGQIVIAEPREEETEVTNLAAAIAERLSAHIENLRLLDETERSRQQLDKRAAELETVAKVSTAAATTLDPQALLQSVVDLTKYSFDLYYVHIYLLDDNENLIPAAGSGKIGQQMLDEGYVLRVDQAKSIVAKAARQRETMIVYDARKDPDFLHHHLLPDTLSEMAIPMVVGDELIGIFDVESDDVNRFSIEDKNTYNTLASQTAVALRNAQLYAEQTETVERLKELDHLKSAFLANMSHELRTPLNSILGFTQVIIDGIDGPVTAEMRNDLGLVEKNSQHLLSLINDVLDMAKIEAGRVSLTLASVNLPQLLDEVIQTTKSLAQEKSLYLELENHLDLDRTLVADAVRLRQVLINLIGNAIKFTKEGGITIQANQNEDSIHIQVIDTGIGIPGDKIESIFEAFNQVDTSTTRQTGGTGLGLPISRKLVELHGGRLWAESENLEGKGSVFHLQLPIRNDEDIE